MTLKDLNNIGLDYIEVNHNYSFGQPGVTLFCKQEGELAGVVLTLPQARELIRLIGKHAMAGSRGEPGNTDDRDAILELEEMNL